LNETVLAGINPYRPNQQLDEANWSNYTQQLCAPGYTGLLCSFCEAKFGQTDVFTCLPCIGVKRGEGTKFVSYDGQVDTQRIILILAGCALGVALVVALTVHFNLQENVRFLQGNVRRHMEVTDVVKILIMYWQVNCWMVSCLVRNGNVKLTN
jgi:hypothetical protein